MKEGLCAGIGVIGGGIAALFGGWDAALMTLIIFMGVDYLTVRLKKYCRSAPQRFRKYQIQSSAAVFSHIVRQLIRLILCVCICGFFCTIKANGENEVLFCQKWDNILKLPPAH